jgi:uncharacterized protein (TIGR02421 family)
MGMTDVPLTAALSPLDVAVDRELAELGASFRFLLDVTPANPEQARADFFAGTDDAPRFVYRPLEVDLDELRARLAAVDPESVQDPSLSHLAQSKHRELCLQVEMLGARGSAAFAAMSVELYGAVLPSLLAEAERVLAITDPVVPVGRWLDAEAFAARAGTELEWYRAGAAGLASRVTIRPDIGSIMVERGDLLVPSSARVAEPRVHPILQHEIGTHVLTYVNGRHQPIRLLTGLAGYDETQEGLALLAEHLVDGLTVTRLRQLAARVRAVEAMVRGVPFRDVHGSLVTLGFSPTAAFATTMRAYRGGGLTKDAVYLRGLIELLVHVAAGRSLDVLLLGKMPLAAVPLVEDLHERGAVRGPALRPRYLHRADARSRLAAIDEHTTITDLARRAR